MTGAGAGCTHIALTRVVHKTLHRVRLSTSGGTLGSMQAGILVAARVHAVGVEARERSIACEKMSDPTGVQLSLRAVKVLIARRHRRSWGVLESSTGALRCIHLVHDQANLRRVGFMKRATTAGVLHLISVVLVWEAGWHRRVGIMSNGHHLVTSIGFHLPISGVVFDKIFNGNLVRVPKTLMKLEARERWHSLLRKTAHLRRGTVGHPN